MDYMDVHANRVSKKKGDAADDNEGDNNERVDRYNRRNTDINQQGGANFDLDNQNHLGSNGNNDITNNTTIETEDSADTIIMEAVMYAQTVQQAAFSMLNLSIQELLDCDKAADQGCTVRCDGKF